MCVFLFNKTIKREGSERRKAEVGREPYIQMQVKVIELLSAEFADAYYVIKHN